MLKPSPNNGTLCLHNAGGDADSSECNSYAHIRGLFDENILLLFCWRTVTGGSDTDESRDMEDKIIVGRFQPRFIWCYHRPKNWNIHGMACYKHIAHEEDPILKSFAPVAN